MIQSQSRVAEEAVVVLLIAVGNQRALFLWPEEVMLLLPLMVAGNKATRCTSTAWPLVGSPQVRVKGELLASISGKRAMTLLAHAMVCPTMMALLPGPGRRKRKRKRKRTIHGFDYTNVPT
jgi:hypothetical protein